MKRVNLNVSFVAQLKPIFKLSPVEMVQIYQEELKQVLKQLNLKKVTSNVTYKVMVTEGIKKTEKLKRDIKYLTKNNNLKTRKILYYTFHRIFQRLRWAMESGSEKEIELRIWCTSSLDLLEETVKLLKEKSLGTDN
jgi:alpha-mannosidase